MKVAIVTGGSSGIGQSAAFEIAKRGVGVILTYHGNRAGGLETAAAIEKDGGTAVALPLDVGRERHLRDFPDASSRRCATVGAGHVRLPGQQRRRRAAAGDFRGHHRGTVRPDAADPPQGSVLPDPDPAAADRGRRRDRQHQQHLGPAHDRPEPGYSAYASMKGAQVVLTRYLAKEFSARGIRVNAVAPGVTRTRLGDDAFARYPELIPADRRERPPSAGSANPTTSAG